MTVPDSPKNTGRPGSGGTSINPSRGMVGVTSFYFLSFSTLFVHFASCLSLLCTLCDVWCLSRYPIIIRATKRCLLLAFFFLIMLPAAIACAPYQQKLLFTGGTRCMLFSKWPLSASFEPKLFELRPFESKYLSYLRHLFLYIHLAATQIFLCNFREHRVTCHDGN